MDADLLTRIYLIYSITLVQKRIYGKMYENVLLLGDRSFTKQNEMPSRKGVSAE
jgi:hypothetical protein